MAFTRDQLNAYESKPQTQVPDTTNPFRGATPAKAADAAAVAAVQSGQMIDATPGGAARAAAAQADDIDTPIVDEDGTLADQSESGDDGTSDEQADPSTATGEPDADADPNADLTGEPSDEAEEEPAPAKGSAQERIVELNDMLEGAKVFGRAMQEQLKAQLELNERIRAGSAPAAAVATPPQQNESDDPGPMPDMADEDIGFDTDKYREKMTKWSKANAKAAARAAIQEMTGNTERQRLEADVTAKVETYAKDNPEFEEVVIKNEVLRANQLSPVAGRAVAVSPYTAELLMKFGKDPANAIRVAKLSPDQQLLEIGEMVAEIKTEKKAAKTSGNPTPKAGNQNGNKAAAQGAPRKSITQAPPPPRATPAAGRSQTRDPLDPNTSMDDFVRQHRSVKQNARATNRKQRGLN